MNKEKIIYYCMYCKDPIYEGDRYIVDENGDKLHIDCYEQINRYDDPFGEDEE